MKIKIPQRIFVSGIGTEIGKTVVSAILVEMLRGNYWKPIQAGGLEWTDTMQVQQWVSNPSSRFYPESYALSQPMSPHAAAKRDGVHINLSQIRMPHSDAPLIVEGAGGLMVPLNEKTLIIDLIKHLDLSVVLVSQNYLGSINHTLLSVTALREYKIPVIGLVFNGPPTPDTEEIILHYTRIPCIGQVSDEPEITPQVILNYAQEWKKNIVFE